MRTIGIVMLFFFFSGSGFMIAECFSKRVRKLSQAERMLTDIIGMVYHQNLPTGEILFRLRQEYPVGESLSAVEAMKVFSSDPLFGKEEQAIFRRTGQLLGTLDRESQTVRLQLEQESLRKLLEDAVKEKEVRGKLCRSAGVLLGALAAVLAI